MLPCNTIAVYNGNYNRKYYQIHPQIGTKIGHNQYIRYDTAFPLELALSTHNTNDKVGHDYCAICRINGAYNNIAVTLCSRCIEKYPEYSCKCSVLCIQSHIDGCLSESISNIQNDDYPTIKECSPECVWFGPRGFYKQVNFKTVGIILKQDSNKIYISDEEESELEEGEIKSDYDSDISNFEVEF